MTRLKHIVLGIHMSSFKLCARGLGATLLAGISALPFTAAHAQDSRAKDQKVEVEAIIVTAQHRKENSQTVPISITTVSGKTLEESGYQEITDLQYVVPGVQYDPTQGSAFQIRGVGSTSFDFSNAKSVNVVVDDVVMDGQRANGLIGVEDIQRVDVLMGPQGTLFGKNSTSGAIVVSTNSPVLGQFSGKVNASYGERNDRIVNATVNVPVTENSALRLSIFDQGQDGYGRYTQLNRKLGTVHEYGARVKYLIKPTEALQVVLAADYARHDDSSIRTAVAPPANLAALLPLYGVTPGPKNADSADTSIGAIRSPEWGASANVTYKIGNDTLTSITAYRGTQYYNNTPADLLPTTVFAYIPYNYGRLKTEKFSQELRWASPTGQFFEYVGGLFYNELSAKQSQLQWATLGKPLVSGGVPLTTFYALTGAIGVNGNTALFDATNITTAAYGQVKFNLTPRFSLALGGRYTSDNNSQSLSFFNTPSLPITGVNATFIATSAPPVYPSGRVRGDDVSYRISPQYKISDTVMIYGTYSTGYKPGGIAFVGNKFNPYKAETVEAYELGIKSELLERRLRLNLSLFKSDFTQFQTTILTKIPDGQGGFINASAIGNAGGLRSQGAELTFAWRATPNLSFNGGVTYTDAKFTDYVANPTTDYTNTRLTNAPRVQGFLASDYSHIFANNVLVKAHIDYAYRSEVWTVVGQPAYSHVPEYGLLNARLTIAPNHSPLQFGLYGRNLGNTYFSTGWQQYGALQLLHYTSPAAYRTLGVFAKYDF